MSSELTPTSYAVLGLLALRSWTTYELAQQMDHVVHRFWPRARSKVYEEPKKLVARGLATAKADPVGRRPRTVYAITPAGRKALQRWLATPASPPVLEWEQLLRVFLADQGTTADLRRAVTGARTWVAERTAVDLEAGRAYLEGRGPFQDRAAVNLLVGALFDELHEAVERWSARVLEVTAGWGDDPAAEAPDLAWGEDVQRSAEARTARLSGQDG